MYLAHLRNYNRCANVLGDLSNGGCCINRRPPISRRDFVQMLTFKSSEIVGAALRLRELEVIAENLKPDVKNKVLTRHAARSVRKHLDAFEKSSSGLHVRTTNVAALELRKRLLVRTLKITHQELKGAVEDIRLTFRRELSLVRIFCIEPKYEGIFDFDLSLLGPNFKTTFASAVYEIDEAGKCHTLGRSTACVFHLMRAMEIGIRAISRSLGIPEPVKGNDRNWGQILIKIKSEMDRRNALTPPQWQMGDRELFASAYASLDAVRVAWRNTTMHVENKYTEDEAEHIFVTVRGFMKKLAGRMDENGQPLA
jgi:hypothetical protein